MSTHCGGFDVRRITSPQSVGWRVNETIHPQRILFLGCTLSIVSFVITYGIFYGANHTTYKGYHARDGVAMLSDTINHQPERNIGGFLLCISFFFLMLSLLLRYMWVRHRILISVRVANLPCT